MSIEGRTVRLHLVEGSVTGIVTAEIMNWTGHLLSAPRTRFEVAIKREELRRTGIYFLIGGDDLSDGFPSVYIGEGDDISRRLSQHNKEKDFWDRLVAITSKDMNLTKAHVRYLEARLLDIAAQSKLCTIENKDRPSFDLLPEADISDMESFILQVRLIMPVIGANFLKHQVQGTRDANDELRTGDTNTKLDVTFVLENENSGIRAKAIERDGEFVVLSGSQGSLKEKVSFRGKAKEFRDSALQKGLIEQTSASTFQVIENISFRSPSAASVFLFGTSRNGRTDWHVEGSNIDYGTLKNSMVPEFLDGD